MGLDLPHIRSAFPILSKHIEEHPLVYLDNAATTQKPRPVLAAIQHFYERDNGNAHRGMHPLAERATIVLENTRTSVQRFIGATHPEEIIFTKNCTEALNLVARSLGSTFQKGDSVVTTVLEHHSNILPWMQLCADHRMALEWLDIEDDGALRLDMLEKFLARGNVRIVTVTAQSNVIGICPDLPMIIQSAHNAGALVCIDAAQIVSHRQIDVRALDCDFLTFSGHKLFGPLGIGVLYGKAEHLRAMPPFLTGGGVPSLIGTDSFVCQDIPQKFEAGTQPIAEAAGLEAAIEWLGQYAWEDIEAHEKNLLSIAREELQKIPTLRILPSPNSRPNSTTGCFSFSVADCHPHDLTEIVGGLGICLRAGHHCAEPLHRRLSVPASTRLSVALYNTEEEIRLAASALAEAQKILLG